MALFYYEIRPGDIDHLPAYEFSYGVVEAEPADVEAIVNQVAPGHFSLLTIRPVDEAKVSLDRFRIDLGQGLSTYHREDVTDTEHCLADQSYIDAYEIDTSGDPALSHDGDLEPDQDAEWTSYAPPANGTPMGLDQVLGCRVQDYELTLPPNKTDALAAALATVLRQDLPDDGQTDDGVADAGLAELLWRFGWKTDEQIAANGWFRLWTDAGGIDERALRALGVVARFVVPGGWLDVVDDNGSNPNWLDAEDDYEGRYRLHFDGEGVTVERADPLRVAPLDDRLVSLVAGQGGSAGRLLCVVAHEGDTAPGWDGDYLALGALLDPREGIGPDQLDIEPALAAGAVAIHLPDGLAGAATAAWLAQHLAAHGVRILAVHPTLETSEDGVSVDLDQVPEASVLDRRWLYGWKKDEG